MADAVLIGSAHVCVHVEHKIRVYRCIMSVDTAAQQTWPWPWHMWPAAHT